MDALSAPIVIVAAIVLIVFLSLLTLGVAAATIVVLAFGARMWASATSEVYRARLHGAQVLETQATIDAATDATEEVRRAARARIPMPTDDELRDLLLAERDLDEEPIDRNGPEKRGADDLSTIWNEGLEYDSPVPGTSMYAGKP